MSTADHNMRLRVEALKRAERYAAMLKKGKSLTEIADEEGISRQAVTKLLDRFGLRAGSSDV